MNKSLIQFHPYHLVEPSPYPLLASFALLTLTLSGVMTFHGYSNGSFLLSVGFLSTILSMGLWFKDVTREGTYQGHHTIAVQKGLLWGFVLFVASEVMFFLSIFWAFFHSSLAPTVELGGIWPPVGIQPLNPFEIPLLNTVILLSSGDCLDWNAVTESLQTTALGLLPFNLPKTPALKRIGPHNLDVLSIIFGSLLGDAHAERDPRGYGTAIRFYQSASHAEYLLWLHGLISALGYCNPVVP